MPWHSDSVRRALFGLLFVTGCHSAHPAGWPDAPDDTQSMLLGLVLPRGGLRVQAFEWPDDRPATFDAARNTDVTVLYYPETLDTLGINPGAVPDARGEMNTRRLPRSETTWASTVRADGLDPWERRTALDAELDEFRIAGGSVGVCAESGGCFVTAADVASGSCAATCPAPTSAGTPMPPMAPAAPMFGTCPTGWRTVPVDGIDTCQPPERTCAGDQFIGDDDCSVVGSACEADGWPAMVPQDRPVRYVDAAVAPGGAGTRNDPHDTIAAALNGAPALVGIVLRRGTHPAGANNFTGVVEFVGGCASETTIQLDGTWTVEGAASELAFSDVTVTGGAPAVEARTSAHVIAESTIFSGGGAGGTPALRGGDLSLTRVVVRDTQGIAVYVADGTLIATDVVVRDSASTGFRVEGTTMATLDDVAVERTDGAALQVLAGADATLTRGYLAEAVGNTVSMSGADAALYDVVIADGQPRDERLGIGVLAIDGSTVLVERATILRATTAAGWFEASTATLRDVVVREVFAEPDRGWHGMAVAATRGTSLTLERFDVADSHRWGVLVESRSDVDADDLAIRRVQRGLSGDTNSVGIEIRGGASAVIDRVVVEGAYTTALAFDDGEREDQADCSTDVRTGMLRVTDADLSGTEALSPLAGIEAGCDSEITFERVRIRGMRGYGVDFTQSAKITAFDLDIEGSRVRNIDAYYDARLTGTRVRLVGARHALRADFRGVVDLTNAFIDCGGEPGTLGILQNNFGEVELEAFEISNCEVAVYGLFSEFVDLADGYIHDNTIAIETDAGIEKFLLRVRYQDNGALTAPYDPDRIR